VITVDTNVLVRILIDDPGAPEQTLAARDVARKADVLFVPQIVQAETVWVLQSAYDLDKTALLNLLRALRSHPAVLLENRERFDSALKNFQAANADFSDCLILAASHEMGTEVCTFDRRLARLVGAKATEDFL
jgi:predicted nucleic-acid-binding protein